MMLQILRQKAATKLAERDEWDFKSVYMAKTELESKETDERPFFIRRFKCSQYFVDLKSLV